MSYDYSIHYGSLNSRSKEWADHMAKTNEERLAPLMPEDKNSRVLDVGCGWGFSLMGLRNLGYRNLSGLERSAEQAGEARRNEISVEVSDDTNAWLRAHETAYDVVLLQDVLEHVPVEEQIDFLKSIAVCLRPKGRLILTVPNANSLLSMRWRHIDFTHWSSFTEHSLEFAVLNAGFVRMAVQPDVVFNRPTLRLWKPEARKVWIKWLVRKAWRVAVQAEFFWTDTSKIPLDLNLTAIAYKD